MKSMYRNNPGTVLLGFVLTAMLGVSFFFGIDLLGAVGVGLAMAAAVPEMLKKLTLKGCGVQPDAEMVAKLEKMWEKDKKSARIEVLDIIGIARKAKPGTSTYGDYLRFAGQFKATNLLTKQEFTAGACILPAFLEEQLFSVMGAEAVNDVQFAFRISVVYDDKGARKYQYAAQPLLKAAENDPLAMLEKTVKEATKQLPSPK